MLTVPYARLYSGRVTGHEWDWQSVPVAAAQEFSAALAEAEQAQQRPYYDANADGAAAAGYYRDARPEQLAELVTRTHLTSPRYAPARELYPWVDLQPDLTLRSLYTGQSWTPAQLIRADFEVLQTRLRERARLAAAGGRDLPEVIASVEAELEQAAPFNCEHVVPQSWFAKQEPMRGDLHHLFACESRCSSFRGNTPYTEFAHFPPAHVDPPVPGPVVQVVRSDCGKSEGSGFEPAHGKGPAARAVCYFALRYPRVIDPAEMPPDRWAVLLAWHEQDPVSRWEQHRNAAIHHRQGNRNPFIDHPEWAHDLPRLVEGNPQHQPG